MSLSFEIIEKVEVILQFFKTHRSEYVLLLIKTSMLEAPSIQPSHQDATTYFTDSG